MNKFIFKILFLLHLSFLCKSFDFKVTPSDFVLASQWGYEKNQQMLPSKQEKMFLNFYKMQKVCEENSLSNDRLPVSGSLSFRDCSGEVCVNILREQAEILIEEIKQGKEKYTYFDVLKKIDFNHKNRAGILILKYKDYPFVFKLSIEHPHTIFAWTAHKSFGAILLFVTAGFVRHITNMTRIDNLKKIQKCLSDFEYAKHIDYPRKWYLLPKHNYDLDVAWFLHSDSGSFKVPSICGIICDYIQKTESSQSVEYLADLSIKITIDTKFLLDPLVDNIMVEKGSHKVVIIDSENIQTPKDGRLIKIFLEKILSFFCSLKNKHSLDTVRKFLNNCTSSELEGKDYYSYYAKLLQDAGFIQSNIWDEEVVKSYNFFLLRERAKKTCIYAKNDDRVNCSLYGRAFFCFVFKLLYKATDVIIASPYCHKGELNNLTSNDLKYIFYEYIPRNVDIAQEVINYSFWVNSYLQKWLLINSYLQKMFVYYDYELMQNLGIDIFCYGLTEFGTFLKLPKKSQKIWEESVDIIKQGVKGLPSDMKRSLIKHMENGLQDPIILDFSRNLDAILKKIQCRMSANKKEYSSDDDKIFEQQLELMLLKLKKSYFFKNQFSNDNDISLWKVLDQALFLPLKYF